MPSYVMYCRKSSESEDRQVLSIESQISELTQLAARLKIRISEVLTESKSAKSPGRPVFDALMRRVYKGEIKGIVAWKLDRLSRNPLDGGRVIWALDQNKITEIVTSAGTYRNTSNEKLMMSIDLGVAKKYVDDLSENVKRGNRTKLEKGWAPNKAPIGYLNEPVERTIVPDPERFPLVRDMWDLLFKGYSPSEIRKIANDRWALRSRSGKKAGDRPLSLSEIYRIFSNSFYYGVIRRKEGTYRGCHKKMITEDEYWKAQEMLGRKGRPRPKRHRFAFTGLIRCGECGCMITAEKKINRYGSHYVYYRCTKKKDGPRCEQKYVNAAQLEAQIIEYLDRIHIPDKLLKIALNRLDERMKEELDKKAVAQKSLEQALSGCLRKLDNLNHMRLSDLIDDEEYSAQKRRLTEERIGLEDRIGSGRLSDTVEPMKDTLSFANAAREQFRNGSLEDKKSILTGVGSNFFLKDKKLLIEAKKPLLIIEKGLQVIRGENGRLELSENGSMEPRIDCFLHQILGT